ncbi:pilin [Francisella sciaenopsi]|uniref:Type IV pili fiber building block protein n=1 Tax=Francisella sciaenopsi TaxID=3055034 RepID=A0ABQ6PD44_9GAMM
MKIKIKIKGFSLIEILIVIVIISILLAVAIPAYSNYQIRSKITSEIEKLGSAKAMASEYASHNYGNLDYTIDDIGVLPSGSSIGDNGALVLDTSGIVADSTVSLAPNINSGTVTWKCNATGLNDSQLPSICSDTIETNSNVSFDSSLSSTNSMFGASCSDSGASACYTSGNDAFVFITDGGQIYSYRDQDIVNTDPNDLNYDTLAVVAYDPDYGFTFQQGDTSLDASSMTDIENSTDLSEQQKQEIYTTIEDMKQTVYCESNSSAFICQ